MDISRRRLLQSLGAAGTVGLAGCPLRGGKNCPSAEDSLETTIDGSPGDGVDSLNEPWPMRYNRARATSYAEARGPQSDVQHRRLFTGEGSYFPSIVVGNDRVYVRSQGAELLAIDPVDGGVDWRYDQVDSGGASVAVTDERVLLASRNGLHAVDATTGEQDWVLDGSFDSEGTVLVTDDTVYAGTWEGLVAAALGTGEVRWRFTGYTIGAVADGRLYTQVDTGLQAVDAADGRELWRNEDVDGETAAVRDGQVYTSTSGDSHFGNIPGRIHELDASDGTQQWEFESSTAEGYHSPAVAPDSVVLGNGYGGTAYALGRDDGQRRWCADFGLRRVVTPVIGGDVVYVLAGDVIQARRLDDGGVLWTHQVAADELLGGEEDAPEFYHQLALSGDVLLAVGYGRRGLAIDAIVER